MFHSSSTSSSASSSLSSSSNNRKGKNGRERSRHLKSDGDAHSTSVGDEVRFPLDSLPFFFLHIQCFLIVVFYLCFKYFQIDSKNRFLGRKSYQVRYPCIQYIFCYVGWNPLHSFILRSCSLVFILFLFLFIFFFNLSLMSFSGLVEKYIKLIKIVFFTQSLRPN